MEPELIVAGVGFRKCEHQKTLHPWTATIMYRTQLIAIPCLSAFLNRWCTYELFDVLVLRRYGKPNGGDNTQLLKNITQYHFTGYLPLIMIVDHHSWVNCAYEVGALNIIQAPYNCEVLYASLREAANKARLRRRALYINNNNGIVIAHRHSDITWIRLAYPDAVINLNDDNRAFSYHASSLSEYDLNSFISIDADILVNLERVYHVKKGFVMLDDKAQTSLRIAPGKQKAVEAAYLNYWVNR